jgi:hypothetical protein
LKKLLLVLFLAFVVFVAVFHQRLFVRDPLAVLTRDGVKEEGAQIFINYSNDVLVENDRTPSYVLVLEHGNHAGTPQQIGCMHWLACMTDADPATLLAGGAKVDVEKMNSAGVQAKEGKQQLVVTLR